MKKWQILLNIILEVAVSIIACILAIILIPKLLGFFWPFVASMILAILARPLASFLEKHIKLNKKWSSALILILVLVGLAFLGYMSFAKLAKEAVSLLSESPTYYREFLTMLQNALMNISDRVSVFSPDVGRQIEQSAGEFIRQAGSLVNNIAPQGVEMLGSFASNVTNGLLGVFVMLLSSYFFIADKDKISENFEKLIPDSMKENTRKIKNHVMGAIGGFMKAQFKIMFIIFIILFIGLLIMGSPYAFLFALLISFLDLLPILGTGTILIPWAVINLLNGNFSQMFFLIILYVICLITRQLLQPKIIGDSVGLDTLPTLFLIYTGYKIAGMRGMILALLIGVIFLTLYKAGIFDSKINRVKYLLNEYMEYGNTDNKTKENEES